MSLQADIREQLKTAMKDRDQTALDALRAVLAAATNEAIALGKGPQDELTDTEMQNVVKRLIKQRNDSIEQFKVGGRVDLIAAEQAQIFVLEQFQPPQMTEERIMEIAARLKRELNITDKRKTGILVGAVMKEVAGQADGQAVKKVVESLYTE